MGHRFAINSGIIISRIIFREACNLARPFAGLRMLL